MYETVVEKINNGDYIEATREINDILAQNIFDEQIAVLASSILVAMGDVKRARSIVARGLKLNHQNYELWLTLGQIHEISNINQAYLCYENAYFYCDNEEDKAVISSFIEGTKQNDEFCVKPVSIVILSYNSLNYTKECIESIRNSCPENSYEIVIIDNASTDGSAEWLKEQPEIVIKCNDENVGFPIGCNQGIELAQKENDIFLLNNDTVLPPNALFWLRMGLYENKKVGATGSVSNHVSNFQKVNWDCQSKEAYLNAAIDNNLPMDRPYTRKTYLVGFAVLLKRKVLEEVGYLDPIYTPGTYEDNDMGMKIRRAGYDSVLCHNSFIYHYGSGGGSNSAKWNNLYSTNATKFTIKWGFNPLRYFVMEKTAVDGLSIPQDKPARVLEAGCGVGDTLLALQDKFPNIELYGIENDESMWNFIPDGINICHQDPISGTLPYEEDFFDVILLDIVYGACEDKAELLRKYVQFLKPDGIIIADGDALKEEDISGGNAS